jgi:predicted esterase
VLRPPGKPLLWGEMRAILFTTLLLCLASPAFSEQRIAKGKITDLVRSAYDPKQTHAVYVPSNYSPDKKWPLLLCFDPRAQGRVPAELFREAAERLGWIIVSSNHSKSDEPDAPNLEVLKAMWSDSQKWFSIDGRRIYTTGFSGGARLAWGVGYIFPENIAGVIGVGAGMHEERPPSKDTKFVWYGITGNKDFNYLEVTKLDRQLSTLQIPRRVIFFEGFHEWPSPEFCSRALDWMELQAMKRQLRARDDSWIQQQFNTQHAEAEGAESSSRIFEAFQRYTHLKEDFEGYVDLGSIPEKISKLSSSDAVRDEFEERKKLEEKEERLQKAFLKTLDEFSVSTELPFAKKLRSDLNLSRFLNEIKEKGKASGEGRMLQRILEGIYAQTSFYLPQFLFERKNFASALVSLTIASEIHPEVPGIWYRMAIAHVQEGEKQKALDNLKIAIDRGLKNRKWIEEEKFFDPIRNDPAFQQLLASLPPQ